VNFIKRSFVYFSFRVPAARIWNDFFQNRLRIRKKVSDPTGSGSATLEKRVKNTEKDDILHISLEKLDLEGRIRIHNTVGEGGDGARVGGQKEDGGT
jgi:hypothetical protein